MMEAYKASKKTKETRKGPPPSGQVPSFSLSSARENSGFAHGICSQNLMVVNSIALSGVLAQEH